MWGRVTLRFYVLLLCLIYFTMLYVFYGRLQMEMSEDSHQTMAEKFFTPRLKDLSNLPKVGIKERAEIKRRVLETKNEDLKILESVSEPMNKSVMFRQVLLSTQNMKTSPLNLSMYGDSIKDCFIPSNIPNRTFQALDPGTFVYSAYFDERYRKKIIRVMSMINLDKKNRAVSFFCTFSGREKSLKVKATMYELCENHGKLFGGYILSCDVPHSALSVCTVNVSMETTPVHFHYQPPKTRTVTLAVSQLKHRLPQEPSDFVIKTNSRDTFHAQQHSHVIRDSSPFLPVTVPYNYTICVPPLFGKIDTLRFVEFIELNRILGFEHFIFYLSNIDNQEIINVLDYYKELKIVTLITWNLPSVIQKGKIWYNGQLNAHNDCLYRGMTISKYLAIIDIDEFIVPHDGQDTIRNSVENLLTESICGLSFKSAFYDPNFAKDEVNSKLLTIARTGRSTLFSHVRTKVIVKPERIFEVGIHHISKPARESLKIVPVNTSTAFLHHYRSCVPNYGMKCGLFVVDKTIFNFYKELSENVVMVMKKALSIDIELSS